MYVVRSLVKYYRDIVYVRNKKIILLEWTIIV